MNSQPTKLVSILQCPETGNSLIEQNGYLLTLLGENEAIRYNFLNGKIDLRSNERIMLTHVPESFATKQVGEKVLLDLGCGKKRFNLDGYTSIGMDLWEKSDADVLCSVFKMPFRDDSIDRIYARHFFEHFTYEQNCMILKECQRVLKPEGVIHITVPHYSCNTAYLDPTHRTFYAERSFVKYSFIGFKVINTRLLWMAKDYHGNIKPIVRLVDWFFNKFKTLERYGTIIGGFYEIEYYLKKALSMQDYTHKDGSKVLVE